MEPDFWFERWENGQIGFHQSDINPYLRKHWPDLALNPGCRVFVPLAGKSSDVLWLINQGFHVTAVEISQKAVEAFFLENGLQVEKSPVKNFTLYKSRQLDFYCGDYFNLDHSLLGDCQGIFDRASLIALPPSMRSRYVQHLRTLIQPGCKILLVTMEYPHNEMQGPPFAVMEEEINDLYMQDFTLSCLERFDVLSNNPIFKERGLSAMYEKVFSLFYHGNH